MTLSSYRTYILNQNDHYAIKTIDEGLTLTRAAGADVLIFTADQQPYKIVIDRLFYQPAYFKSVIPVIPVILFMPQLSSWLAVE